MEQHTHPTPPPPSPQIKDEAAIFPPLIWEGGGGGVGGLRFPFILSKIVGARLFVFTFSQAQDSYSRNDGNSRSLNKIKGAVSLKI